ncbi:MAG: hypothetical protein JWO69_317, partial [Thermoleophilia bacterium]|nr:hypothetical protein [Thermoleophilia bacterium]
MTDDRTQHPSNDELLDLVAGALDPARRPTVE